MSDTPSSADVASKSGLPPAKFRAPFIIGVTGNCDPEGYGDETMMAELRAKVRAVLEWVRAEQGRLDRETGRFDPAAVATAGAHGPGVGEEGGSWQALGLVHTPVLVLSSLAPGIDTIVAETVLDYAERHEGVSLMAPLGFPKSVYRESSSFWKDGSQEPDPVKLARFDKIVARLGEDAVFEVALDNDLRLGEADEATLDLKRDDPRFGKPRRRLRYRAAGEYIAAHSDLLLAIYDDELDKPAPEDLFSAGSATIVEAKRSGLTHELLAVANNFSWADNGLVLVIPIRRGKRRQLPQEEQSRLKPPGRMKFLHPHDLRPRGVAPADWKNAEWQQAGDARFRRVIVRQERFNGLQENPREAEALDELGAPEYGPAAAAFARKLERIARVRRRASDEAGALQDARTGLLRQMFWLIFAAASLFGSYEHWHNSRADHCGSKDHGWWPHDAMSWIQCGLLVFSFGCLVWSARKYYKYRNSGKEEARYDYRAVGEALRVQFYWQMAGTGRSVSAEYMQRQRDELDWIRYAVSSLSMPFETARRAFLKLGSADQVTLLEAVRDSWICKQLDYFAEKSEAREKSAHLFHSRGWTFAAGGLLSMAGMFLHEVCPRIEHHFHYDPSHAAHHPHLPWAGLLLVAGGILFAIGRKRAGEHGHAEEPAGEPSRRTGFMRWILGDFKTWGGALMLAAVIFGVAFTLGRLTEVWPDQHNWWIILTGCALLAGGLQVAWAERNFFGEEARQFRAMAHLFACANRRLEKLVPRYDKAAAQAEAEPDVTKRGSRQAEAKRLLFEIHDILHQLGCEALDESAEWLIQHRARPLEPLLAG